MLINRQKSNQWRLSDKKRLTSFYTLLKVDTVLKDMWCLFEGLSSFFKSAIFCRLAYHEVLLYYSTFFEDCWSFFSKVHLLTKSTRFAKSLSSDIDLDFHSLFSNKGPFFVFQIGLWIFGTYKIAWNDIKSIAGSCFWCHVEWFAESPCSYHKTLNWIYLHLS